MPENQSNQHEIDEESVCIRSSFFPVRYLTGDGCGGDEGFCSD